MFILLQFPYAFCLHADPSNLSFQEEDILDLLEQCELDDEKLTGRPARSRGPKVFHRLHWDLF